MTDFRHKKLRRGSRRSSSSRNLLLQMPEENRRYLKEKFEYFE